MAYDAFISYSHSSDRELAAAIRDGLQRLAKPWNRRRSLSVFLDQSSLSVGTDLDDALSERLRDAAWLVLLMSEDSAASRWVGQELAHWLATGSRERLALVLTSGAIVWDAAAADFDFEASTAVPEALRGVYLGQRSEPLYLDLRWARTIAEPLSLDHARFRDAVASLAAPIHGIPKDELEGEDIRQHRRATRLRRAATAGLALLTLVAVAAGVVAMIQRSTALRERDESEARRLAVLAESNTATRTDAAMLLALASLDIAETEEGWDSLLMALTQPVTAREGVGHDDAVMSVAFSADGRLLASAGADATVRLWDPVTAEPLATLEGHDFGARVVAFDPRSRWLASAGEDGRVLLWDVADASGPRVSMHHDGDVAALAFDAGGELLASGGLEGTARVWRVPAGEQLGGSLRHEREILAVAFSGDGARLVTAAGDGVVRTWDAASAQLVDEIALGDDWYEGVAFDPRGEQIAVPGADGSVDIYDVASGELLVSGPQHPAPVVASAFSGDGSRVATASRDWSLQLWDATSGETISGFLRGHAADVFAVAIAPSGALVASAGNDRSVRLWETDPAYRVGRPLVEQDSPISAVAIDGPGDLIAFATDDGGLHVVPGSGADASALGVSQGGVLALDVDPTGEMVAGADYHGEVRLWPLGPGAKERILGGHEGGARALGFDPRGGFVATGGADHVVRVWDVVSGDLLATFTDHGAEVRALEFDAATGHLASVGDDGTVSIRAPAWERDGTDVDAPTTYHHADLIWDVGFDADGAVVTASRDGTVQRWRNGGGGREPEVLFSRPEVLGWVQTAAFSPDGALLALGETSGAIHVWEVQSGARLATFTGHADAVFALAFSGDAEVLVSGSDDGSVRWWPARTEWRALACAGSARPLRPAERSEFGLNEGASPCAGDVVAARP